MFATNAKGTSWGRTAIVLEYPSQVITTMKNPNPNRATLTMIPWPFWGGLPTRNRVPIERARPKTRSERDSILILTRGARPPVSSKRRVRESGLTI